MAKQPHPVCVPNPRLREITISPADNNLRASNRLESGRLFSSAQGAFQEEANGPQFNPALGVLCAFA
jgi:hypothetical protein